MPSLSGQGTILITKLDFGNYGIEMIEILTQPAIQAHLLIISGRHHLAASKCHWSDRTCQKFMFQRAKGRFLPPPPCRRLASVISVNGDITTLPKPQISHVCKFLNVYKTRNTNIRRTINASYVDLETNIPDYENMIITITVLFSS